MMTTLIKKMEKTYEELETICANCSISFKIKDMKVDQETNKLVCVNCFSNPNCKIFKIR